MIRSALLSALLLSACGGGEETRGQCADEAQVLAAVNAARSEPRQCGATHYAAVQPLSLHGVLTNAAQVHASDLASSGKTSHTGSDGSTVADRAAAYRRPVGENVASGQIDLDQVMREFLASPGHCQNIMNPYAVKFGAACVDVERTVWVQVYGV